MKISGILLDLDNTIYEYEPLHKIALQRSIEYIAKVANIDSYAALEYFTKARKFVNQSLCNTASCHNRLLYFQKLFELLNINTMNYALDSYNVYWNATLDGLVLDRDAEYFLQSIKSQNIKICVVTDLTAHIQFRKIEKLKLAKYIDYIVTSEEVGAEKPDSKMFELALEKLNLNKNEVCMVGDNYKKDCLGANESGILSFWYNRKDKAIKIKDNIIEVRSLSRIVEYIKKWN